MSKQDIEIGFPALVGKDYEISDEDFNYNCLAYALGDYHNWWEPPRGEGRYWPPGFAEDTTVETAEKILGAHGFTEVLPIGELPATDSIAIYAIGNEWQHFARFSGGAWSSKLGEGHDVSSVDLGDLAINDYGTVVKVLSRPNRGSAA
jgi:hypothetical protein